MRSPALCAVPTALPASPTPPCAAFPAALTPTLAPFAAAVAPFLRPDATFLTALPTFLRASLRFAAFTSGFCAFAFDAETAES
jgi:hypothetical protein